MKAMILAAGRGKRLRPLTDTIPKPLLKLDNFAIIEHLLFRLSRSGFDEIVINIAYLAEQFITALGDGNKYGVKITYSPESPNEGLETGGGIYNALPLLGNKPFLVVSGDIWTNYPFHLLNNASLDGLAHLVLVDNPIDHGGDFYLLHNKVTEQEGVRLTYGNIGVYHPDLFAECSPGFFPIAPLIYKAVTKNQVTAEHFQGDWHNIGTPETLSSLRQSLLCK